MTEQAELDQGLWLSVTALAARKGVRKSTISEKVTRLVETGVLQTRPGKGREKLINVAAYDVAVGEVGDAAKEAGAATKAASAPSGTSRAPTDNRYRDEQARDKAYSADIKEIELEKLRGNLLPVSEFDPAADDAATRIVDIIEGLLARDSELTSIAVKEGENGVRAALKRIIRGQREAVVLAMKNMAANARALASAEADAPLQAELLVDQPSE